MNHRRALRTTTDTALTIFGVMTLGVILWTSDEVLGWNILPDWIDKYAQLIVILLSVLAGFAVVMSLMASFAVMAESAAKSAGIEEPRTSPRLKGLVAGSVIAFVAMIVVFQRVDQYRERQRVRREKEQAVARFDKVQAALRERIAGVTPLFTDEIKAMITSPAAASDAALAQFLRAIRVSLPDEPGVCLLVRAQHPYTYCALAPAARRSAVEEGAKEPPMTREFYVDLPARWEKDTVRAMFQGRDLTVPPGRPGVFINTRVPCAWGLIRKDGEVCALLMLRGST